MGLLEIGAAAGIASAGMQGAGMIMGSKSNKAAAAMSRRIGEFNALVNEEEAALVRRETHLQQIRDLEEGERAVGTLRARMGVSGARLDVGAPLRAEAELAQELDINQLLLAYEGEKAARRFENEAALNRMGGSLTAQQYNAQATANLIKAGSTLLSGVSTLGREFGRASTPVFVNPGVVLPNQSASLGIVRA